MDMPFTRAQFLDLFHIYNHVVWPAQVIAYLLGAALVLALWKPSAAKVRVVLLILATFWLWNGVAYHLAFFTLVNPAAFLFAILFIAQGVAFGVFSFRARRVLAETRFGARSLVGTVLIAYALLIYPTIGQLSGHGFLRGPMFGVAPCPTAIFTIGVLFLLRGRGITWLFIIPIMWSVIGMIAAVSLEMPEDWGLGVAGIALLGLAVIEGASARFGNVSVSKAP
jgi:hypothetical protein